jgi:hypothetical protein
MRRALGMSLLSVSALSVALLAAGACGGDDDAGGGAGGEAEVADGTIGEPAEIGDLTVTVSAISFDAAVSDDPPNVARVKVDVQTENTSDEDQDPVDFNIFCDNSDESGGYYDDSTYVPTEPIPAGDALEGELFLGVPEDCENPTIHASLTGVVPADGGPSHVAYPLPDDVVDQITG